MAGTTVGWAGDETDGLAGLPEITIDTVAGTITRLGLEFPRQRVRVVGGLWVGGKLCNRARRHYWGGQIDSRHDGRGPILQPHLLDDALALFLVALDIAAKRQHLERAGIGQREHADGAQRIDDRGEASGATMRVDQVVYGRRPGQVFR